MSKLKFNYSLIANLIISTICLNESKLLLTFWLAINCIYYFKSKFTIPFGEYGFAEYKPSALVILGSGGHTWEMLNILSQIEWQNYLPIYCVSYSDNNSLHGLHSFEKCYQRQYLTERLTRPREHCHKSIFSPIVLYRSFGCFMESVYLINVHKPDYLISNGPNICVPPIIAASLLRKLGFVNTKIVYIESMARVKSLSISAKIVRKFVDYMFGFWSQLCDSHNLLPIRSNQMKIVFNNNSIEKFQECKSQNKNISKIALVTVGTTKFTELVNVALSQEFELFLIDRGFKKLIVQIGSLELEANINQMNYDSKLEKNIIKLLPSYKFSDILREVDLVISHGGTATIFEAMTYGKQIVVVPNEMLSQNHQLELVNRLSESNLINVSNVVNLLTFLKDNFSKLIHNSYSPEFQYNLNDSLRAAIGESRLRDVNNDSIRFENKRQFSIIIPSTISDSEYLKNLLSSLYYFLSLESVSDVLIIVPNSDFIQMTQTFSAEKNLLRNKIHFIKETELIPEQILSEFDSFPKWRSGWFKQQVLKLSVAFFVKTEFYLILDSDCILTKHLEYSDLFYEKDNKVQSYYQTEGIYLHQNWWTGSAKLLGINKNYLNSLKDGIGVTPQTLSVQIVKEMCSFIEKSHPNNGKWYSILCSFRFQLYPTAIWTEFTLYYLFAVRTGLLNKYHIQKRNALSNYSHNLWQLHQTYDWNPFKKVSQSINYFTIFQSNLRLSNRISRAFLLQYIKTETTSFISCLMIFENEKQVININAIQSSIHCYCQQIWPKSQRELLIVCTQEHEVLFKDIVKSFDSTGNQINLIIADKCHLIKKCLEMAKGDYIGFWPSSCWSSPYRLSVQYEYLKDLNIKSCHISPLISGNAIQKKFCFTYNSDGIYRRMKRMSLFCNKELLLSDIKDFHCKALNEPTLLINVNLKSNTYGEEDAVRKLQPIDSVSHLNELIRITGPFIDNSFKFIQREHKKVYFISSELDVNPVIGGINTFLRVIISELQNTSVHFDNDIEFVFCGIKCGQKDPNFPKIKGLSFKFFETENSKKASDLEDYFKSFPKYSSTIDDLKSFGHSVMSWIRTDAVPGDVCITTIVYECDEHMLNELCLRGIKLIHTVHSLVPLKIMFNSRCIPFKKLNLKDIIRAIFIVLFRLDEYKLVFISNHSFLRWILPKFITESIVKEQLIMSLSQAIFVPSKKLAQTTASLYPSVKHKVRYVPWGLPKMSSVIGDPNIGYESVKNISDSSTIKCLALCKLVPQKGVDLLLDAFYYIEKMDASLAKRLELNICGDMSYMEENQFFSILQRKCDRLKHIKVHFNGWLTGQSKLDQLRKANIFVSPSLTEPFGFSLLEAMKAGLPVVSFATEGPQDIIDQTFGKLIPICDNFDNMAKDFAIAIIDLCFANNYKQMCEQSNRAANQWNLNDFFENLFSIL